MNQISISIETFRNIINAKIEYAQNTQRILDKQIELARIEAHMATLWLENCQEKKRIVARLEEALERINDVTQNTPNTNSIDDRNIEADIVEAEQKANAIYQELNNFDESNPRANDYQTCLSRMRTIKREIEDLLLYAQEIEHTEHDIDVPRCH